MFYAVRVDARLQLALDGAPAGARAYFDDSSPEYLRVLQFGHGKRAERWLGKMVPPGPTLAQLEDVHRNVASIMRRIAPDLYTSPAAWRLFVVHAADGRLFVGDEPETIPEEPAVAD
jgi:hypothetical protein